MKAIKGPYFYTEDHAYYCIIEDNDGNSFIGVAICHPEDRIFESEKVGYQIALCRAQIKVLQHYKNNVLTPQLKGFNDLYYSFNSSSKFNSESYEARRIVRYIKRTESDLKIIREEIEARKKELRIFLAEKDKFRESIKRIRATKNN